MTKIITHLEELDFRLNDIPGMPVPSAVLMIDPAYFTVEYVINPHMEGNIGKIDKPKAKEQWTGIKSVFQNLGLPVYVVDGQPDLPDMVFSANQSLPFIDPNGKKHVVMSIMHSSQRKDEVAFVEQWYRLNGYEIHHLDSKKIHDFEGMGDAIWHSGKRLLWGGYGYRSSLRAYQSISELFNVPIIVLELTHPEFYHLDTCFCSLNEESALIYPEAFTEEGLRLIKKMIPHVYEVNSHEAEKLFACNATSPDGKNVIIQKGCTEINKLLSEADFTIHEVDTSEYLKSGGSVFCMKMLLW